MDKTGRNRFRRLQMLLGRHARWRRVKRQVGRLTKYGDFCRDLAVATGLVSMAVAIKAIRSIRRK